MSLLSQRARGYPMFGFTQVSLEWPAPDYLMRGSLASPHRRAAPAICHQPTTQFSKSCLEESMSTTRQWWSLYCFRCRRFLTLLGQNSCAQTRRSGPYFAVGPHLAWVTSWTPQPIVTFRSCERGYRGSRLLHGSRGLHEVSISFWIRVVEDARGLTLRIVRP
jgi:hypothetical protein